MRDAAFACIRRVGVETGGSNVQFALDPTNGEMVVIEMNPRVSRSSALASKATGFPIAKIAARLAVGYTLDEIPNDITRKTPASFEPTIDYVVTKVPRWAFEKFPGQPDVLGTQMQSVGEAMAIGRTFPESLQKALRSLEHGRLGLNCDPGEAVLDELSDDELRGPGRRSARPTGPSSSRRRCAGASASTTSTRSTKVDPWFLDQISLIVEERAHLAEVGFAAMDPGRWRRAKRLGFADAQLAWLWAVDRGRGPRRPPGGRRADHVQDGRHLRRRVRGRDAVPLLDLRGRGRGAAGRPAARSSSSARAPTASARASSSTTAASTPASPCATPASRRSWSTATPRRCRPTTTPATASTSSRSPTRTCSTSSRPSRPRARSSASSSPSAARPR